MQGRERRKNAELDEDALRRSLTPQQLHALETLEHFQWTLKFVRRPLFQDPVPVLFDRNRDRFVVLAPDGSLLDDPDFRLRD